MATPKRNSKSVATNAPDKELIEAQRAHDILFQDVYGTLTLLQSALETQDTGRLYGPEIDCIASGGAERAAKAAANRIRETVNLLEGCECVRKFEGAQKIRNALFSLQDIVELAAHALELQEPLHGSLTRYPALTAVKIAARDSYAVSCRLDERMLEWRGTRPKRTDRAEARIHD